MFKKSIFTIIGIVLVIFASLNIFHNSVTDRINPIIPETQSYAKVPKGKKKYTNVKAFNFQTGKLLPYKIKEIGGYEPSGCYIAIDHKGQYVRSIEYISKKKFEQARH